MGSLSVKIGANTADLEKNIDRAKKILEKYSQTAHKAKSEIEQNVSVSNQQANAYQRVVKQLEKVNSGTLATTQQQKVLSNQVKELKIQWNALTDDQKISGFGQSIAQSLKAAESELETTKQKIAAVSDQTEKTSSTTSKFDSAIGTLSKTFGALGLAVGAAEATQKLFNAAIDSSQALTDTFNYSVGTLNGTLGELAYAVFNIDFDYLSQGLVTVARNAWEAQAAADQLFNTALSYSVVESDAMAQIARAREIITDPNSTKQQIDAAKKSYLSALDDMQAGANQMANKTMDDINATIKAKGGKGTETLKSLGQKLKIDASTNVDQIRKDLAKATDMKKLTTNLTDVVKFNAEMTKKYGKDWNNTFVLLNKLHDDQLTKIVNQYNTVMGIERRVAQENRKYNKLLSGDGKETKKSTSGGYKAPKAEQKTLIQQLEESNKKLQEEYEYRVKNYNKLSELVQKQEELNKKIAKQKELELLNTKALDKETLAQAKPVKLVKSASEEIKDVNKDIKKFSKDLSKSMAPDVKESHKQWEQNKKDEEEAIKNKKKLIDVSANFMSVTAQMVGEETAAGQALMAMSKMIIIAKEAEALAKGIAEAAATAWPANIPAITSVVAAITSIFSQLPKFADGGIFQGGSSIGDYNIARVNNGEMILNGKQQAKLFKMLDDPYVSHAPNISYMQPEVKIKGSDIYLSQKNYKAITGRKI